MKNYFSSKKQPFIYITLCFAFICWIFFFAQIITSFLLEPAQKVIPAFQTSSNTASPGSSMVTYPVSAFPAASPKKLPNENTIYTFLKQYDKEVELVACHNEKNYTDLYFYSPILQQNRKETGNRNFNLQVAVTKSAVYFGTPFLNYDF